MNKTTIEVTRKELSMLEEAVSHLMMTKRGPRFTEMLKLRTKLAQELAVAIEEDREMESNKNRWFVKKDHYLNADDYNVCMQPADSRLPSVCIGSFRGIEELKNFANMLRSTIETGTIAEDIREAYAQIISAISKEEAAVCG